VLCWASRFSGRVLTGDSADFIEDMYSPHTAAINFISDLIRKPEKENLQLVWTHSYPDFKLVAMWYSF
jgi:hypothetical protein